MNETLWYLSYRVFVNLKLWLDGKTTVIFSCPYLCRKHEITDDDLYLLSQFLSYNIYFFSIFIRLLVIIALH